KRTTSNPAVWYSYPQPTSENAAPGPGSIFNQQGGSIFNQHEHPLSKAPLPPCASQTVAAPKLRNALSVSWETILYMV
ncbi:hypothetical protein ACO0LM_20380, partial [Undibacterium sp. Di26W]|uniref:hypothetical protein n=1 Tax=Undibacterium sp. Di26W TaxID=3413035 RepID=UPI003BF340F9